ncbi:Os04g0539601, partial [Oryza sativa Japonica Group]
MIRDTHSSSSTSCACRETIQHSKKLITGGKKRQPSRKPQPFRRKARSTRVSRNLTGRSTISGGGGGGATSSYVTTDDGWESSFDFSSSGAATRASACSFSSAASFSASQNSSRSSRSSTENPSLSTIPHADGAAAAPSSAASSDRQLLFSASIFPSFSVQKAPTYTHSKNHKFPKFQKPSK